MRVKQVAPVVLGLLIAAACGGSNKDSQVQGGSAASANGTGTGSGTGTGNGTGAGGNGLLVGSGGSTAIAGFGNGTGAAGTLTPDSACATSAADGQLVPVDLYFMVDITGSMKCPVPQDPNTPCMVDPGPPYSMVNRWTTESAALNTFLADPANAGLGVGINYFPSTGNNNGICNAASYVTPAVEIAALPGTAAALDKSIAAQMPGGNTPTVPSIDGAIQHAEAWAKANPTHRVAVVYSTDGYPQGCTGNTIAAAATIAAAGFKAGIPTYVLGVGPNLTDLNTIAASGGTTKAFAIDTTANAAADFAAALASIRTSSVVGCTYIIPPPPANMTLDPSQVNVVYTDSAGKVNDVLQEPAGTDCADMNATGWQYSADMKQINLCGSVCTTVTADKGAKLQVLFGCATQVGGVK